MTYAKAFAYSIFPTNSVVNDVTLFCLKLLAEINIFFKGVFIQHKKA